MGHVWNQRTRDAVAGELMIPSDSKLVLLSVFQVPADFIAAYSKGDQGKIKWEPPKWEPPK